MKILFQLTDEDAQELALRKIGRELTEMELYNVKKGVAWGLDCWSDVMIDSIKEATNKNNKIK